MKKVRAGSRESRLAVRQAEIIISAMKKKEPQFEAELITMKTSGDMILDRSLDAEGGKGLFTRELDRALLDGRIDIAVHSLKDLPAELPEGLFIGAFFQAEDPRDALVLPAGQTLIDISKPAGCAGKRRSVQLAKIFPDWRCALVRGNVFTRLEKLDHGAYGALILAAAGLKRLGLEDRIYRIFEPEEMLPAAGQGILAVVARQEADGNIQELLRILDDPAARRRALAERAFVRALDSGCGAPAAVFAQEDQGCFSLRGFYAPDGLSKSAAGMLKGSPEDGETLGRTLAYRLLAEYNLRAGRQGRVILLGAGPGDAGLLTVKGAAALAAAEVVVFDKLTGAGILAMLPEAAEKIYAGKEAGNHAVPQAEINNLLIKKAAQGKLVVRLKGGDPYLFGRGGEEALSLAQAGIPFEVIPGISSALAVPACANIPVTHRGIAAQVHIIAAHNTAPDSVDMEALVKAGGTLVFLMGAASLEANCRNLLDAGLPPDTPAAIIEQGTTSKQKKCISTAGELAACAAQAGVKAPAVIVIGEVCRLERELSFVPAKPLAGLRIALTRPREGAGRLSALLAAAGAEIIELPAIRIVPLEAAPELEKVFNAPLDKTWFAFTSAHGVDAFFAMLKVYRKDIRCLAPCKFAAIGKMTAAALETRGITADLVPEVFSGKELGAALARQAAQDERVVLPRSAIAGDAVLEPLIAAGIKTIAIPVYETAAAAGFEDPVRRALLLEGLDWAAFTSASSADNFARIFGGEHLAGLHALCIGPATAAAAGKYGMTVITAKSASIESMVEALLDA